MRKFYKNQFLTCNDAALVNKWLCCYVLETWQESGKPYPKTLYSLLCGLLQITCSNKAPFNFLDRSGTRIHELHLTLDSVCSELNLKGICAQTKAATIITYEDEVSCMFWRVGVLDYGDPRVLLNKVFFHVGLYFSLCGGQEQRDLSFQQFTRVTADDSVYNSDIYYMYVEFALKNN